MNTRDILNLRNFGFLRREVVLGGLVANILILALPVTILQIYDRVIPKQATATFTVLMSALFVVIFLDSLIRYLKNKVAAWEGARFEHVTGIDILKHICESDIISYERSPPGVYIDKLVSIEQLREFYSNQMGSILIDFPFGFIFVGVIFLISPTLAAVALVIFIACLLTSVVSGLALQKTQIERAKSDDRRYSFIIDILRSILTVKGLGFEEQILRRHDRLQESSSRGNYFVALAANMTQNLGLFFSQLTLVSVAGVGSLLVIEHHLTVGSLAACTLLAGRAIQPLMRGIGVWTFFQNVRVAQGRLISMMSLPVKEQISPRFMSITEGRIELENLSYHYPDGKEDLLSGINLTLPAHETIALTGKSASGKSTLLLLLMGLLHPTKGKIRIDGVDLAEIEHTSYRQQIAYLSQRPRLFNGTLQENLTLFDDSVDVATVMDIVDMLGLRPVFARLPQGLNTTIGDSDFQTLPLGVRQRIAIARDLGHNKKLILFDEANNAFDIQSDTYLRETLAHLKGTATIILVSHRPSIITLADHIYRLEHANIRQIDKSQVAYQAPPLPPEMARL